jgi:ABC-type transporter Mla MlaB component
VHDFPSRFPARWAMPVGAALTVLHPERVIVWLFGQIDVNLAPELARISAQAPGAADQLVVDTSRATFVDATLAEFVTRVQPQMTVTMRRPTHLVLDLLSVTGVRDSVKVDWSGSTR